jgi:hypothetical protein
MASMKVVPPDPGHAPASSARLLPRWLRRIIIVLAVIAVSVGSIGWLVAGPHPLFIVLVALGVLAAFALLPAHLPVIWGRLRS